MRALVYHGPGNKAWEEVPRPGIIADTDAIVRVDAVTICGTDLHILKGDVPAVTDGRILGHEAVGTVEEVGSGVKNVAVGDRVLVSCITACGACRFCREGRYGQCLGGGGWILGHLIDGTQAEYVRVPFADTSTYPVPDGVSDEEVLMLADILPDRLRGRRAQRRGAARATSSPSSAPGRSACPRSWAPGCSARPTSSRSTWPTPGSRRPSSSAPTSSSTTAREDALADRARAHRRARRRRRHRGGRRPRDVRAVRRAGPARRARRQHRRARRAGDAAPGGAVDPGRHHHHRPGRHLLDADAAHARHERAGRRRPGSSPTASRWRTSWRRTTCSPAPARPVR